MRSRILLLCVVLFILVGCTSSGVSTNDTVSKINVTTPHPVCFVSEGFGAWTFTYIKDARTNYATGYGFAVRMTEEEYQEKCIKYRK